MTWFITIPRMQVRQVPRLEITTMFNTITGTRAVKKLQTGFN